MTVCIGLLCEGRSTAVVLADKMVSIGEGHWTLQRDGLSTKLAKCSRATVMLHSGSVDSSEWVLRRLCGYDKNGLPVGPEEIYNQVHHLQDVLTVSLRDKLVKSELGDGFNFNELTRSISGASLASHVATWQRATSKNAGYFLVAGVSVTENGSVAQIFVSPNTFALGSLFVPYAAIGSGSTFARASLDIDRFDDGFSLEAAILAGVRAKHAAELAHGVGRECDIVLINSGGVHSIEPELVKMVLSVVRERGENLGKAEIPGPGGQALGEWLSTIGMTKASASVGSPDDAESATGEVKAGQPE